MPILVYLKSLANKNTVIGVLVVIIVLAVGDAYRARQHAKEVQIVYENPQVKTVERIVYKEGPTRIVTRIVKEPQRETTEIIEEHAPIETVTETGTEKTPVAESVIMAPTRTDRYLVSFGLNRLTPDLDGKALFVGYGFKNRLDLQVGGIIHDGFSPWLLATARF